MQGLGGTSARASKLAFPPCSIDIQSTFPSPTGRQHSHSNLPFASWIKRPLVFLASIFSLTILLTGATCYFQSAAQLHRHCTSWPPWHQVFAVINNQALQSTTRHSTPCETSFCFDVDIGARIVNNEITHLTNILNLVDGCGRPFDQIFDPDER